MVRSTTFRLGESSGRNSGAPIVDEVTFSKATGVKLTVGAVISLMMFAVFVDRRFGALESQSVSQRTDIETLTRRQQTYIERRSNQHDDFDDALQAMNERLDRLCEALASRESEVICND